MKLPQARPDWHSSWNGHESSSQVGLLIDGDSISHKYIDTILSEAITLGPLLVPRVFGNWDMPSLQGWQRLLIPYRLERRHHKQVASGKNATDIALVIDALELLYQHGIRLFCLAVADSDYTPLVSHLQNLGSTVWCLGITKTVPALKEACIRFVSLDQSESPIPLSVEQKEDRIRVVGLTIEESSLEPTVITAYNDLAHGKKVWVTIPDLEKRLKTLDPSFSSKDYGHRTVSKLVKAKFSVLFEVRSRASQQNVQELRRKE